MEYRKKLSQFFTVSNCLSYDQKIETNCCTLYTSASLGRKQQGQPAILHRQNTGHHEEHRQAIGALLLFDTVQYFSIFMRQGKLAILLCVMKTNLQQYNDTKFNKKE
jgi:hypothetical protein